MTVVIAIRCSDALVMASDSQATEAHPNVHQRVRRETDKVFPLGGRVLWGASGMGSVIEELGEALPGHERSIERSTNIPSTVKRPVKTVLKNHYDGFVRVPEVPLSEQSLPVASVLFAGYDGNDDPYIVEVDHNCNASRYEDEGFHAIGSGASFAQMSNALLAHFEVAQRPLAHGLLVAYRVLDAVINTSAYGVGGPIQLWQLTRESGAEHIRDEELSQIQAQVGGWQTLERESLERYLGEDTQNEDAEPLPEAIADETDAAS